MFMYHFGIIRFYTFEVYLLINKEKFVVPWSIISFDMKILYHDELKTLFEALYHYLYNESVDIFPHSFPISFHNIENNIFNISQMKREKNWSNVEIL